MTIDEFIKRYEVTAEIVQIPARTDGTESWEPAATHWDVTIKTPTCGMGYMSLQFSQGSAYKDAPSLATILDCLASDVAGVGQYERFEDWANDHGYDDDSRKAERIYKAIQGQDHELRGLLGPSAYRTLIDDVERL